MTADTATPPLPRVLAWGAYLAVSWTWCIGMFLPVLLIRDFGVASFLVFAIPNVVGAAAMGVVLRNPQRSRQFVRANRAACWWFSIVTAAFQAFFLAWLLRGSGPSATGFTLAAIGIAPLLTTLRPGTTRPGSSRTLVVIAIVYAASLAIGIWWLLSGYAKAPLNAPFVEPARATELLPLALVCLLGFTFCPFLDLTFHETRQALPGRSGSRAFVIGFGVFFLSMILLTLAYSGHILAAAAGMRVAPGPQLLPALLAAHIAVQLGVTLSLHSDWGRDSAVRPPAAPWAPFAALIAGIALAIAAFRFRGPWDLSTAEVIYRGFMGFYGLVFPAYIWICTTPWAAVHTAPSRRAIIIAAAAIAAAAPFYYIGFIERRTWWLAGGVLIVIAARFVARAITPSEPAAHPAPSTARSPAPSDPT